MAKNYEEEEKKESCDGGGAGLYLQKRRPGSQGDGNFLTR